MAISCDRRTAVRPSVMPEHSVRPRRFWYLPVTLLIAVACVQLWLSHTAGLSPWAGGGFGMFSSTDTRGNRHLHAFAIRPGIRRELDLPSSLNLHIERVLVFPTESALRSLAAELAHVPTPDAGPLAAIEIQVWTTRFDPHSLEPSSTFLRVIEVPFGAN
jgi:hypothetical protein